MRSFSLSASTLIVLAEIGFAALLAVPPALAAEPSLNGTWELNVAKSVSTDPMPKSITRIYEVTTTTEKLTGTIVTADGKSIPIGFTATLDGNDSPYTSPGLDAVALTSVDALTVSYVSKLGGKQMQTGTRVLSADGQILTFNQKGQNPAGKPFEARMVYDRRP